jgi:hypothetical protein
MCHYGWFEGKALICRRITNPCIKECWVMVNATPIFLAGHPTEGSSFPGQF